MRAYLAVVIDAFRAALASKVLYVSLAVIVLLLIAIAPLSYSEGLNYHFTEGDLQGPMPIAERLVGEADAAGPATSADAATGSATTDAGVTDAEVTDAATDVVADGDTPRLRVWNRLRPQTRKQLREFLDPDASSSDGGIQRAQSRDLLLGAVLLDLNEIVRQDDFYDPAVFAGLSLSEEGEDLRDRGLDRLSSDQRRRLNRLALEAAFPLEIRASQESIVRFTYLGFVINKELGPTRTSLRSMVTVGLPWFLDKFVLSAGVLLAILFTANMVPELLEPGSLNLLLSKPVRRWGLFLSKYVGACAFATVNATILFVGLWLYFGIRLGIWNNALLCCTPIYVLVFAIYYAVSALVGLVFRGPILAVVASIAFWAFCFGMGLTEQMVAGLSRPGETTEIVDAGGTLVKFDRINHGTFLKEDGDDWEAGFQHDDRDVLGVFGALIPGPDRVGMVFDAPNRRLILVESALLPDNPGAIGASRVIDVASERYGFRIQTALDAPNYTRAAFGFDDRSMIFVTGFGRIERLAFERIDEALAANEGELGEGNGLDAMPDGTAGSARAAEADPPPRSPQGTGEASPFQDVSPEIPLSGDQVRSVAFDRESQELVFFGKGLVTRLHWSGERFEWGESDRVKVPSEAGSAILRVGGGKAYLLADDGWFCVDLAASTVKRVDPPADQGVQSALVSPDGSRIVVIDGDQVAWAWDGTGAVARFPARYQGRVAALGQAVDPDRFLIADKYGRVVTYDWQSSKVVANSSTSMSLVQQVYTYVIYPAYWLSPKPGEFYRMVQQMSEWGTPSEDPDGGESRRDDDLNYRNSVWMPLWNGMAFIAVMLGLSIWYFERQDF